MRGSALFFSFQTPFRGIDDRAVVRAGFTLIELLLAIGIILILIAIALPQMTGARDRARAVQCMSNLRVLGEGLLFYKIDHNRFPLADGCAGDDPSPDETCLGEGPAALGSWDGVPWILHRMGYVTERTAFFCPAMQSLFPEEKDKVRYAYNSGGARNGGPSGGADNIERDSGDLWLCRCVWLPAFATFDPDSPLIYPHGNDIDAGQENVMENVVRIDGTVETTNGLAEYRRSVGAGPR